MNFALAVLAVLVVVSLVLVRPYLRRDVDGSIRRRRANATAYHGRLAEIAQELDADVVEASAVEELRLEAAAQLLEADIAARPEVVTPRRLVALPAAVLVLAVLAGLGYWQAGSWRTVELIELAERDPSAAQQHMVADMVAGLEQRLQAEPDDAEGWAMLGRSYSVLGRGQDAATAWARANAANLEAPQADWLVAEGEARALLTEPRDLAGSRALFERALQADPKHPRALLYLGLAAAQGGDYDTALDAWLTLRAQPLPPEIAALLEQRLPQLAELAGRELPAAVVVAGPELVLDVSLAPTLQPLLADGMTLFVFARAEQGPPMPLAVQRLEAPKLPLQVRLTEAMAMTPELRLSQFPRWTVVARLSRSGGAEAVSGDLEGRLSISREQADRPWPLVMDRVIP